jgi:ribulose-bisphosphate carboxylase large chain
LSHEKKPLIFCDREKKHNEKKLRTQNKTRLYKYKGNFTWRGIKTERYKPAGKDWSHVIRQTVIGTRGETTKFHLRYFEIAPGGFTSFEVHRHEHVVIGIRGRGLCSVETKKCHLGFLDVLYIEPNTPHQLSNPFREPFGFFCIVNAKRDRPKVFDTE